MRRSIAVIAVTLVVAAMGTPPTAAAAAPTAAPTASAAAPDVAPHGDVSARLVPRPPYDSGHGATAQLWSFTSTTGNVRCRRVASTSGSPWLECLLVRTNELLRYGYGDRGVTVPCVPPKAGLTCMLSYGRVQITHATTGQRARFARAPRVGYERPIQLGPSTVPYPRCIVDPNLGTRCSPSMDDVVNQEIIIGVSGSIWTCPGYEISEGTPVPQGGNRCLVLRP